MKFNILHRVRNKIKVDKTSNISIGKNFKMTGCKVVMKGDNNSLIFGDDIRLRNLLIEVIGENCSITVGSGSTIGEGSYISAREQNISLIIGERCGFSRNVKIMTSDGHPIYKDGVRINEAKSITIEDDVWVADNVIILKGVTIGSGSVVGINSTVVKNIPKESVAVGNPAKVVKENITWQDKF
ncbi:MAG: acyltransferase [Campylobacterales bacterium]|nr:acyltransferase [Campylobacterales bacterium]